MYVSTDRLILESWYDGIPPVLNWKIESFNIWFWRMEKYHCVWVHWKHCLRRVNGYGWSHCPFYITFYILYVFIRFTSALFSFQWLLIFGEYLKMVGKYELMSYLWVTFFPLTVTQYEMKVLFIHVKKHEIVFCEWWMRKKTGLLTMWK